MLTVDNLTKYLQAAIIEKAKAAKKLLSWYRYGFILSEKHLAELQKHSGYYKSIKRYIENPKVLSLEEITAILRKYNIDNVTIPELEEPVVKGIIFVPKPIVELTDIPILVDFVPKPMVEFPDLITVDFVPKAIIEYPDLIMVDFVPKPIIQLLDVPVSVSFVPKPIVELDITNVLIWSGVLPTATVSFPNMNSQTISNLIDFSIEFERIHGYPTFAVPANVAQPGYYYISPFNKGKISSLFTNILATHNGIEYRVYRTIEKTKFEKDGESTEVRFAQGAWWELEYELERR